MLSFLFFALLPSLLLFILFAFLFQRTLRFTILQASVLVALFCLLCCFYPVVAAVTSPASGFRGAAAPPAPARRPPRRRPAAAAAADAAAAAAGRAGGPVLGASPLRGRRGGRRGAAGGRRAPRMSLAFLHLPPRPLRRRPRPGRAARRTSSLRPAALAAASSCRREGGHSARRQRRGGGRRGHGTLIIGVCEALPEVALPDLVHLLRLEIFDLASQHADHLGAPRHHVIEVSSKPLA
mmetsp:Transcript_101956/g.297344  ORF Transcript_101956/g.297344 Transcript_101956/m.297344 type:complete len:238 (+) Transcript_101956:1032-1745(+)